MATVLFVLLAVVSCVTSQVVRLDTYNVDKTRISTSGISSGACFATQFHVAVSSKVMGCGMVAGAPYYCSQANSLTSLRCMDTPTSINDAELASLTLQFEAAGEIDPTGNLGNDRVFIFNGATDTVVVPGVAQKVYDYYRRFVNNVGMKTDLWAEHGYPTTDRGTACAQINSDNYINNCNYEAAYEILNYIYGGLTRPTSSTPLRGQFLTYDQGEFFYTSLPGQSSMDTSGHVYVPSGCVDKQTTCRLHIAFHGCEMGKYRIGSDYHDLSGLSHVGELNNIIILYPQAIAIASNPYGCWDWWGYNDPVGQAGIYAKKGGNQILAVTRMMDRVAGF